VLANPAQGVPHVIHTEAELATYTEELFQLTVLDRPSASQLQAIELFTHLIESYEATHYPTD
jgi:hypothetical protein